ncbi:MAG: DNA mismatch repair protein MutT, partial [Mesorhizobium sp.]
YTLEEMAEMPLAGDVFSVAEELLGPAQGARR